MGHTIGKWEVYTGHDGKLGETLILAPNPVTGKPNLVIASVSDIWPNHTETAGNAAIIAAAPAMAAVLETVLEWLNKTDAIKPSYDISGLLQLTRQVVAQAHGKGA